MNCGNLGRELSLIFDGSTRLGEAIVIIARYVDDNWKVQQQGRSWAYQRGGSFLKKVD